MKIFRTIQIFLISIWLASWSIFALFELTPFDFKNVFLKTLFYDYNLLSLPLFGVVICTFLFKKIWIKVTTSLIACCLALLIMGQSLWTFAFWHGHSVWITKDVIARNKIKSNLTIEEQWLDSGALGYVKRNHQIINLSQYFDWKVQIDSIPMNGDWILLSKNED